MRVPIVASHQYFCRLFWPMEDKTLLITLYSYSFLSLTCEQFVVLRACVCFFWISQVHIGWFDPRINYTAYRLKLLLNSRGTEESYLTLFPVKFTSTIAWRIVLVIQKSTTDWFALQLHAENNWNYGQSLHFSVSTRVVIGQFSMSWNRGTVTGNIVSSESIRVVYSVYGDWFV